MPRRPAGGRHRTRAGRPSSMAGGLDAAGPDWRAGTPISPSPHAGQGRRLRPAGQPHLRGRISVYRQRPMQTSFSLGPDSVLSGFPGHRPVFSPSERIDPARWEQATPQGLYRLRDWHTFRHTGGPTRGCRTTTAPRIGGRRERDQPARNAARLAQPSGPIRYRSWTAEHPAVLADGWPCSRPAGVLGLEGCPIRHR